MHAPIGGLLAALALVFGTAVAFAPIPRITWEHREVGLVQFHEPGIYNYSALLMSQDEDTLYVGAREAVFALRAMDISRKQHEVYWKVSEDKKARCAEKGKSKQTECLNYIRVLQPLSATTLYVCGTNAFQPTCDHLDLASFKFLGKNEDGKGRCPFDPAHSYTSVMVDGELYSGTSYNFLGSEPIISRNSSHSPLRTEYAIPWLNEPSFVFSDVIRRSPEEGEDDRVYFFFTEAAVEYEFVFKLMVPRVARVCRGDQGGLRTLQKKWTSFLKARLTCSRPDSGLVFNVLQDVFVLRAPGLKEPVFYALFTPQLNNVGLSAVCVYNLSAVEAVFSGGKYMQSATVEQSHTKWVRYNGPVPTPRPGAVSEGQGPGRAPAPPLSPSQGRRFVYAGSNSGVVQAPLAFCEKHSSCADCVLARDPYCAWSPATAACVALHQAEGPHRGWIQEMSGDASLCPDKVKESYRQHFFKHGGTAELRCALKSNLARVVWKFQNGVLKAESPKYGLMGRKNLLIFNLSEGDSGVYQCLSEERVRNKTVSQVVAKHLLEVKVVPRTSATPTLQATRTEESRVTSKVSVASTPGSSPPTPAVRATSPGATTPPPKPAPTSTSCEPQIVFNTVPQLHSEKTMYLKSSDNRLLMSLFLFIFVLFLCLVSYNCYQGYLPGQCLKFRSALLLGKKKPKSDFSDLEQSVKETLVEPGSFSQQNGEQPKPALDTGYETEQDTITSKVPTDREDSQKIDELSARDRPFDVKCELKFADSDADGD
ncbi:semaphorin-4D [Ictidomys tridecemlineatus]|nr:semaphorin-4D [Ictidomys tridecemlineatus]